MNYLETTWKLFSATGQVSFYLLFKELEEDGAQSGVGENDIGAGLFDGSL